MGITYLGPIDGHNIEALTEVIEDAKQVEGAVLIHVIIRKGKGIRAGTASSGILPWSWTIYKEKWNGEKAKGRGNIY